MKTLQVIESLGRGGAEQALVNLLPVLQRRGIAADVLVLKADLTLARSLQVAGVRVWTAPDGGLRARHRFVRQLLREHGHDAVNAHLTRSLLVCGFGALPVPLYFTAHNLGYAAWPARGIKGRVKKWLAARIARRRVRETVAVSDAVAAHYRAHWGIERVRVIGNPVEVPQIDTSENGPIVVPGRLVPEKGHALALQVAAELHAQRPELKWLLAGGGPLHKDLQERIDALGLHSVVRISGALPHGDFLRAMATAAAVLVPSEQEGFGIAAAEAMRLGKAVVATRVGGLAHLLGEGGRGWSFDSGDAAGCLNCLTEALDQAEKRVQYGQKARDFVLRHHSTETVAEQWQELYLTR